MTDVLLQSCHEGILTLTLNRPDKRNALSAELIQALHDAVEAANVDDPVKAVILTGSGQAFCAGLDLDEVQSFADDPEQREAVFGLLSATFDKIHRSPKPIIAAVNGFAVAGGAALMSVCDIVIAAEFTKIGYPEIQHGLVAAVLMPYLIRQVGERRAKYLLLTGEMVLSKTAKELGLVDEVVATADVQMRAKHLARQFAGYPKEAFQLTKKWLSESQYWNIDQHIEYGGKRFAYLDASDADA